MRKRTKCIIGGGLFALSLLVGIPGCVHRTGTLFCDTKFALSGPVILVKGTSMWGAGPHRDAFSTTVGSFLTLKLLLFSWWWDTLCIPYDIYLKFDGVNFYVYDQDGKPIPDVLIRTHGEDSFYGIEEKTDAKGRLYYPRRVKGFTSLTATKEGYWGRCSDGSRWLSQSINAGLPPMLNAEFRNHVIEVPTTNDMHTLNLFMKKIPQGMPIVDSYDLVVSNVVSGVEYGVDLSSAELCPPFGNGRTADIIISALDIETTSHQRIRSSATVNPVHSKVVNMVGDGCGRWPFLYYVPPSEAFDKDIASDGAKAPMLIRLDNAPLDRQRYTIIASCGIKQYREQGTPLCIYLRYWNVDVSNDGVLVCDYWSRKVAKVLVPVTEETIREDRERMEEEARARALEKAEQEKRAERKRKNQEHLKRFKALDPYVEALFSNEDDFYKALEHSDDPLLRHRWAWAIEFDTYSRKVRKEYLEEILKKVEEKPGEDDRRIKRAINKALAR